MRMTKAIFLLMVILSTFVFGQFKITPQAKAYKGAELFGKAQNDFTYGKIEARMMVARGGGILSTLFTWKDKCEQSGVFWEELDVEVFGKDNATKWQTNQIHGFNPIEMAEEVHSSSTSLADDFHTYSIEWTPDYISWSLDGIEVRKNTGSLSANIKSPAGIRFNIWASTSVAWAGTWDESVLPQYQFVNWVKYYKYEDSSFVLNWTDDFDLYNSSRWAKANWTFDGNRVDFEPNNVVYKDGMLVLCLTKENETGFHGDVPQDTTVTSIEIKNENISSNYLLKQNYPNPFNPKTNIVYEVPNESNVEISIYDILGNQIEVLINKVHSSGIYNIDFDGSKLSGGVYFYRLISANFVSTKKLLLLK